MSRSVDQIQLIVFAVQGIIHLNSLAFDGDTAFFFQVHIVEHLVLGNSQGSGMLQQAVGKRAFAVINVGYDAKIANMVHPRVRIYFEAAKLLKFMQVPAKFFVFLWLIKQ